MQNPRISPRELVGICESRHGWAIAEQLRDVLKGEDLEKQNINALYYIARFLRKYPNYNSVRIQIEKYLKMAEKNPVLRGKTRSELSKAIWRRRKREGGKAKCSYCGRSIFAGGVVMAGRSYHKGCAELRGARIRRYELVRNPRRRDRVPRDAFRYFGARALNPFRSITTGKGTTKELIVFPPGVEEGVLVNARTGKATNRWADGTAGVPKEIKELAEEEVNAYMPYSMEQYDWSHKNPKYVFGPTGFRPPAKWFAKMAQGASASYFGKKVKDLTKAQGARVGQIVGGIWAKYSDATRRAILKKYEPAAARANPTRRTPPYIGIAYKYFVAQRIKHLVLQGMTPQEAMKKAASEWREQKSW